MFNHQEEAEFLGPTEVRLSPEACRRRESTGRAVSRERRRAGELLAIKVTGHPAKGADSSKELKLTVAKKSEQERASVTSSTPGLASKEADSGRTTARWSVSPPIS